MTLPTASPRANGDKRFDDVLAEVEELISRHTDDWRQLQSRILGRVREYQKMSGLRGAVYNIYSREDRQSPDAPHRHLKAPRKIAEEVHLNRFGGTKSRAGQPRKIPAQPGFTIYDVSDIVGVTIVCPFDADVDRVVDQIEADCHAGLFQRTEEIKRHDRRDYQAVHAKLRVNDERLRELQVEVQVKTAVQDAFSWKTHALAYKPGEDTDPWFIEQFIRISVLLRTADGISDQLRGRLEEGRSVGIKKRQAVRNALLLSVTEYMKGIGDQKKRKELLEIFDRLGAYLTLPAADQHRETLDRIREAVEKALKKYGYDANTFRLAVLCAMAPKDNGYRYGVDRHFRTWTAQPDPANKRELAARRADRIRCANLIAISHYCSNDVVGAIQIAETALRLAGKAKIPEVGLLSVNLAYYCAELANEGPDYREKAETYARNARAVLGEDISAADRDSLGFVRIATGGGIADIEEGLAECRQAHDELRAEETDDKMLALVETFFDAHRELAYKRLAQMVSA